MRHLACLFALLVVGCSRTESRTDPAPAKPGPAPVVAAAASGAPGAGNRSGSSIANARALLAGTPATFTVPCTGEGVYVGPFTLKRDPERLVVRASTKGTSAAQVCVSDGHWVDGRGEHPMVAGLPCVEGGKPVDTKLEYEYSPGNGGNNATPIYWRVRHTNPKPAGCDTVAVTLSFP